MSDPPGRLGDLRQLMVRARHAQLAAAARRARPSFATSQQLGSHRLLLALTAPDLAAAFRASTIDPLIEYDQQHNAALVQTLRCFLHSAGAWQRTATELHIHVNTLRYRLQRVEELTHRRLSEMEYASTCSSPCSWPTDRPDLRGEHVAEAKRASCRVVMKHGVSELRIAGRPPPGIRD